MLNVILSLISILIVFYLFFALYLKCKMPFWSKQPVFHIYNLSYWINPPGVISKELPLVNKYVDLFNIKTYEITNEERSAILTTACNFIKNNYIHTSVNSSTGVTDTGVNITEKKDHAKYLPSHSNIIEYLTSSNYKSYLTVLHEPKLLFNKSEPTSLIDDTIAVITSRPLYVRFKNKTFPTYYVDNLCVLPAYRKKNIASKMIQTHCYNLRKNNNKINTCFFKREGELSSIVPLVVFNTYCFNIKDIMNNTYLDPSISLIEIGTSQLQLVVDFIKGQMKRFSCIVLPDVTSIMNLIKTKNIVIYALLDKAHGQIVSCYFFRIIELFYGDQRAIECFSTILGSTEKTILNTMSDIFIKGFLMSLQKLKADIILLEDTANTNIIINHIKVPPRFVSPTAFFFYNYACYSVKKNDFLILY